MKAPSRCVLSPSSSVPHTSPKQAQLVATDTGDLENPPQKPPSQPSTLTQVSRVDGLAQEIAAREPEFICKIQLQLQEILTRVASIEQVLSSLSAPPRPRDQDMGTQTEGNHPTDPARPRCREIGSQTEGSQLRVFEPQSFGCPPAQVQVNPCEGAPRNDRGVTSLHIVGKDTPQPDSIVPTSMAAVSTVGDELLPLLAQLLQDPVLGKGGASEPTKKSVPTVSKMASVPSQQPTRESAQAVSSTVPIPRQRSSRMEPKGTTGQVPQVWCPLGEMPASKPRQQHKSQRAWSHGAWRQPAHSTAGGKGNPPRFMPTYHYCPCQHQKWTKPPEKLQSTSRPKFSKGKGQFTPSKPTADENECRTCKKEGRPFLHDFKQCEHSRRAYAEFAQKYRTPTNDKCRTCLMAGRPADHDFRKCEKVRFYGNRRSMTTEPVRPGDVSPQHRSE